MHAGRKEGREGGREGGGLTLYVSEEGSPSPKKKVAIHPRGSTRATRRVEEKETPHRRWKKTTQP